MVVSRGMIHILRGNGPGKTTAAAGLCVRFIGAGGRAVFAQFLKSGDSCVLEPLRKLGITVISPAGNRKFLFQMNEDEKHTYRQVQKEVFRQALEACRQSGAGLLVLDEVLDAVEAGMLDEKNVLDSLSGIEGGPEIVLTGHGILEAFEKAADYITETVEQKHPYRTGTPARRGIEY